LPGCLRTTVSGTVFFDRNHTGKREPHEPGFAWRLVAYNGGESGQVSTDDGGNFSASLVSDPAYLTRPTSVSLVIPGNSPWTPPAATVLGQTAKEFGSVYTVKNSGGTGFLLDK
jgi:hypothetical protein